MLLLSQQQQRQLKRGGRTDAPNTNRSSGQYFQDVKKPCIRSIDTVNMVGGGGTAVSSIAMLVMMSIHIRPAHAFSALLCTARLESIVPSVRLLGDTDRHFTSFVRSAPKPYAAVRGKPLGAVGTKSAMLIPGTLLAENVKAAEWIFCASLSMPVMDYEAASMFFFFVCV